MYNVHDIIASNFALVYTLLKIGMKPIPNLMTTFKLRTTHSTQDKMNKFSNDGNKYE